VSEEVPPYILVELRRRTLPEQVEYLVFQVALLVARLNQMERDAEALVLAIKSLENRLTAVERATPWQAPKPPPKAPYRRS